jgi:hypothetical protein
MLTFGFRRGETLKVYVTDVNVRGRTPTMRIVRRPGDPNDTRAIEPAVKTLGREVPLQREIAAMLNTYIQLHRSKFPNAEDSPFLFLSDEGKPLSLRMVNYVFAQIVRRFPAFNGLLTPHVMRHSYNDMLSKAARENGLDNDAFKALGGHFKRYHPWPLQTVPVRARVIWEEGFLRSPLCLPFSCRESGFVQPVALAAHFDEMAVMHESIEEGRNGGGIAEQFRPILERTI